MDPQHLRDYQATERTFLAWIRTNLALIALGFVVARVGLTYGASQPVIPGLHSSEISGLGFVVVAVISQLLATRRYRATCRAMLEGKPTAMDLNTPIVVGIATVVVGGLAVLYVAIG